MFLIQARDDAGNKLKSNQETFTATFTGPDVVSQISRPVNPDMMDGLYKIEYMLEKAGQYMLEVQLANKNIKGSPFELLAVPGSVAAGTTIVYGLPNALDGPLHKF